MNKTHRIVWNHVRNCLMVVSEAAKTQGKAATSKEAVLTTVAAAVMALSASEAMSIDYVIPTDSQEYVYDSTLGLANGDTLTVQAPGSVGGSIFVGVT